MRAVVFDIDGTLSDASHRLHHVTGGNRNWDAFFTEMAADPVVEPIRDLRATVAACQNRVLERRAKQ